MSQNSRVPSQILIHKGLSLKSRYEWVEPLLGLEPQVDSSYLFSVSYSLTVFGFLSFVLILIVNL
jgi:hypothetical protein